MKHLILVILMAASALCTNAQDATVQELKNEAAKTAPEDTALEKGWKTGGLFTLNLTQGSLSNWQGGGDKSSFSAVGFLNVFAIYRLDRHSWANSLDLGYGYVNTTSLGTRKSDDRIDLISKYGYQVSKKWFASTLFNFRTQFTDGFSFDNVNGTETKTLTSGFLAPAYVLLSLGMDYKPSNRFSLFLSPLTQRWVLVQDDFLSSIGAYGVEPGSKSRSELGAFLSATFNQEVMKNVVYKSRLDAFSNYRSEPQNVDLFWTNIIALKVNEYLSANVAWDLLYDDNAIGRVQIRQLLGVGFSARF
jgi:hypothetical protein